MTSSILVFYKLKILNIILFLSQKIIKVNMMESKIKLKNQSFKRVDY